MDSMLEILARDGWREGAQRRAAAWIADPSTLRADSATLPTTLVRAVLAGIEASVCEHTFGDEAGVDGEVRECLDVLRAELVSRGTFGDEEVG